MAGCDSEDYDYDYDWENLWEVEKNIFRMMLRREYEPNEDELERTFDEFKVIHGYQGSNHKIDRGDLYISIAHLDADERLCILFFNERTIGTEKVREIHKKMKRQRHVRAILVTQEGVEPAAREALDKLGPKYVFEYFLESELLDGVFTDMDDEEQHEALSMEVALLFLEELNIDVNSLEHIAAEDPICRYYGIQRGEVARVTNYYKDPDGKSKKEQIFKIVD